MGNAPHAGRQEEMGLRHFRTPLSDQLRAAAQSKSASTLEEGNAARRQIEETHAIDTPMRDRPSTARTEGRTPLLGDARPRDTRIADSAFRKLSLG